MNLKPFLSIFRKKLKGTGVSKEARQERLQKVRTTGYKNSIRDRALNPKIDYLKDKAALTIENPPKKEHLDSDWVFNPVLSSHAGLVKHPIYNKLRNLYAAKNLAQRKAWKAQNINAKFASPNADIRHSADSMLRAARYTERPQFFIPPTNPEAIDPYYRPGEIKDPIFTKMRLAAIRNALSRKPPYG